MSDDHELQTAIAAARSATPRFLFRYWNATYGGHPQHNTRHAITPSAFKPDPYGSSSEAGFVPPKYDETFIDTAIRHLEDDDSGAKVDTFFSTWSHSLAYVLSRAQAETKKDSKTKEHAYIAVMDTAKGPDNVILHTSTLHRLFSDAIPIRRWGYLAHGIIPGEAYTAVRWSEIEPIMRQCLLDANQKFLKIPEDDIPQKLKTLDEILASNTDLAALFEIPYRKVIMCHVLAMGHWAEAGVHEIVRRIGFSGIPQEWVHDTALRDPDHLECHDVLEVLRANEMLRQLIVLADPRGGDMTYSPTLNRRVKEARAAFAAEEEAKTGMKPDVFAEYEHLLSLRAAYKSSKGTHPHRRRQQPLSEPVVISSDDGTDGDSDGSVIFVRPKSGPLRVTGPDPPTKSSGGGRFGSAIVARKSG